MIGANIIEMQHIRTALCDGAEGAHGEAEGRCSLIHSTSAKQTSVPKTHGRRDYLHYRHEYYKYYCTSTTSTVLVQYQRY
jgi:hypothetical protein